MWKTTCMFFVPVEEFFLPQTVSTYMQKACNRMSTKIATTCKIQVMESPAKNEILLNLDWI